MEATLKVASKNTDKSFIRFNLMNYIENLLEKK